MPSVQEKKKPCALNETNDAWRTANLARETFVKFQTKPRFCSVKEYSPFDSKKKREYLPFSLTELTSALAVSTDRARMYVLYVRISGFPRIRSYL
jgi:hypothetical protein